MLPAGSFSKLSAVRADLLSQTASMLIAKVPVAQIARQLKITERTVWRHKKALRARHKVRAVKQLRQGAHPDGIIESTVLSRDEVHQLRASVLAEKARRLGAAE